MTDFAKQEYSASSDSTVEDAELKPWNFAGDLPDGFHDETGWPDNRHMVRVGTVPSPDQGRGPIGPAPFDWDAVTGRTYGQSAERV